MRDAKQKSDWEHTSAILTLVWNVNCTDKNKAKTPSDFNPYCQKSTPIADMSILKEIGFTEVK